MNASGDFLIRIESDATVSIAMVAPPSVVAAGTSFTFEPLFEVPIRDGVGIAANSRRAHWHRVRADRPVSSAWDAAYQIADQTHLALSTGNAKVTHVEPDLIQ